MGKTVIKEESFPEIVSRYNTGGKNRFDVYKLGAEDNGFALRPWLNDLKQVVRLLVRHRREKECINDQHPFCIQKFFQSSICHFWVERPADLGTGMPDSA